MNHLVDEDIDKIVQWPYDEFPAMMDFIKEIWWLPEWGWRRDGTLYRISTGGWSDNEAIIEALQRHLVFWSLCWRYSRVGGHYTFRVKKLPKAKTA